MSDQDELGHVGRLREWMNTGMGRCVTVGACLAAMAGAAALVVLRPSNQTKSVIVARGRDVAYFCKACQRSGQAHIDYDDGFPIVCPQCRQKQAVMGITCPRCRNIIEKKSDPVYACPHCQFVYDKRIRAE